LLGSSCLNALPDCETVDAQFTGILMLLECLVIGRSTGDKYSDFSVDMYFWEQMEVKLCAHTNLCLKFFFKKNQPAGEDRPHSIALRRSS